MSENEAVTLLSRCKPLSQKLIDSGCSCRLTSLDSEQLKGLRKVQQAGLAASKKLQRAAGLSDQELILLFGVLAVENWQLD